MMKDAIYEMIGAYMPPSIRGKGCPQHEFSSR
jgi:hypothetical protein